MTAFSKEAEDKLLDVVRQVQGHVSDRGLPPTEAVVKAAKDNNLPSDMLPLVVQAYNVGRQSFQREKCSGEGILCKAAEFPIARIEDVRSVLYPSQPSKPSAILAKAAVDKAYAEPPRPVPHREYRTPQEKQAHVKLPESMFVSPDRGPGDPKTKVARAEAEKQRLRRAVDQAKTAELHARDLYLGAMGQVADYFKQADYTRLPLAEVEYNSRQMFGPSATDVINFVAARNRTKEARAQGPPRLARPADKHAAPYNLVSTAIKRAGEYVQQKASHRKLEKEAQEKIASLMRPFDGTDPSSSSPKSALLQPISWGSKEAAGLLGGLAGGMMASLARGKAQSSSTPGEMVGGVADQLDDPVHNSELRGIQSRAVLNDLLANDEVVSGYDPTEVSSAFNEIVQLSPSAAIQPALMRPLLRKRLTAGSMEPFEAQQMADVEKTMRQTESAGALSQSPALGQQTSVNAELV